jgi:hypothetical protein
MNRSSGLVRPKAPHNSARRKPTATNKKVDLDQEIEQHKADSIRNEFSIATQQVLQPNYGGHHPPSLILIGMKSKTWLTSTLETSK